MVARLETNSYPLSNQSSSARDGTGLTINKIERLVGLVRKGNVVSLTQARLELGVTLRELARVMGVSESTLKAWETAVETPPQKYLIAWRLKMGDFIDEMISSFIGTSNEELITQFWEIMWRLNEINFQPKS
jgi:DNA-binding transcriptional regulator YiaG